MANPWCRLWAEMPNDPKWRTIARVSGQSIGDVVAVYVHMMVCASNATERGRTEGWSDEDMATAIDVKTEQVTAIREAMQGRVLSGDYLSGWEKRQPVREDGSAERAKAFRDRKKEEKQANQTHANADERNQPLDKIRQEEIREEKKTPKIKTTVPASAETAEVFEYWKTVMQHPAAQLDAKRSKAISGRLKDGYTVGQLCKAVDGCKYDPFSQGANDRRTVYDDIELICRDGPKVDKFIGIADRGPQQGGGRTSNQQQTMDNLQAYLDRNT